jgi:AcrR family transcriptional regulator
MVGVVPNAAYRHFASRDELLASVCAAALRELAARMAAGVAGVPGRRGDPAAARSRFHAIGVAYLEFAREEPGLFATAFALPQQHAYDSADDGTGQERTPSRHGTDPVAGQGEHQQPSRVQDRGLRVADVDAEGGLAVGPRRDQPGPREQDGCTAETG